MNRVIREQKKCRQLWRANRQIKELGDRLEAAEAQIAEQDKQIGTLITDLRVILHHITGESVHLESVRNMTKGMLLEYGDPSEPIGQSAIADLVDFMDGHFRPKSTVHEAAVGINRWIAAFDGDIELLMQYHILWTMAAIELSKPFGTQREFSMKDGD